MPWPEFLIRAILQSASTVNLPSSTDWYIGQVGYQAAGGIYSGPGQWNWGTAEQSSPDDYLVAPQAIWPR